MSLIFHFSHNVSKNTASVLMIWSAIVSHKLLFFSFLLFSTNINSIIPTNKVWVGLISLSSNAFYFYTFVFVFIFFTLPSPIHHIFPHQTPPLCIFSFFHMFFCCRDFCLPFFFSIFRPNPVQATHDPVINKSCLLYAFAVSRNETCVFPVPHFILTSVS